MNTDDDLNAHDTAHDDTPLAGKDERDDVAETKAHQEAIQAAAEDDSRFSDYTSEHTEDPHPRTFHRIWAFVKGETSKIVSLIKTEHGMVPDATWPGPFGSLNAATGDRIVDVSNTPAAVGMMVDHRGNVTPAEGRVDPLRMPVAGFEGDPAYHAGPGLAVDKPTAMVANSGAGTGMGAPLNSGRDENGENIETKPRDHVDPVPQSSEESQVVRDREEDRGCELAPVTEPDKVDAPRHDPE